jgi:hypothetical protein
MQLHRRDHRDSPAMAAGGKPWAMAAAMIGPM